MRHLVDEVVERIGRAHVFQPRRHGRCRDRRLLGGHGPVQQHHDHERDGIVHAESQAAPERRQAQAIDTELGPRGECQHRATAGGGAQHVAVLRRVARDVVFAAFGAALGHLGGRHVRAAGDQRADAALVVAHLRELGHQPGGRLASVVALQAIDQLFDAHHALAQLAEAKDDADRDAVLLQMRVDRVGRMTAGVELLAQGLGGGQGRRAARTVGLDGGLEGLEPAGQGVKRPRMERVGL